MLDAKKHPTPFEKATLARLTLFQAQVLRDAFCDGTESCAEVSARTGLPLALVEDFRLCRYKALVPPEITVPRGSHLRLDIAPEPKSTYTPRCLRHNIPSPYQRMAEVGRE